MIAWPPQLPSPIPNGPWKSIDGELDGTLPQADVSAYESAAGYLKKMQPIMKSLGRQAEWATLLVGDPGEIPQPPAVHGNPGQARRPHHSPNPKSPQPPPMKGVNGVPGALSSV